jgi:hypothetical protein
MHHKYKKQRQPQKSHRKIRGAELYKDKQQDRDERDGVYMILFKKNRCFAISKKTRFFYMKKINVIYSFKNLQRFIYIQKRTHRKNTPSRGKIGLQQQE